MVKVSFTNSSLIVYTTTGHLSQIHQRQQLKTFLGMNIDMKLVLMKALMARIMLWCGTLGLFGIKRTRTR